MLVYLVRHGESETNRSGIRCGQMDVSLTSKGQEDARRAGETLRGILFDRVYSSDLKRAMETAEIALPGIPVEKVKDLREIDIGLIQGKTNEECAALYGPTYWEHYQKRDYTAYGGENQKMQEARVFRFMDGLEELNVWKVAVFCHEYPILAMLDRTLGKRAGDKRKIGNGEVVVLEYSNSCWTLESIT